MLFRSTRCSSRQVIHAAIAGDVLIATTKFCAAAWTGSAAMLSEAVHSLVDTGNALLLLYGLNRSERPANVAHPLGYGREIYFWSFVVAVAVFALGAGVSLYQGVLHVLAPTHIRDATVNYVVLALSALFDGTTWYIAFRNFKGQMPAIEIFSAIRNSKDPPSFIVLFEDGAALIGLLFAFLGTYLSIHLNAPILDGVASIIIGFVLAASAVLLARETKGLLIGEAADPTIVKSILQLAADTDGIVHANGIITLHLAPRQIVVVLSLEFADELKTPEIERKVADLEDRLRRMNPDVVAMFVKPQSASGYLARHSLHR